MKDNKKKYLIGIGVGILAVVAFYVAKLSG